MVPSKRSNESHSDSSAAKTQDEQWFVDLRRKRNLQVTGKIKPPLNRSLPRLKQILKSEGFKIRGNKIIIKRSEATFEVDLKMGHVSVLHETKEPQILCVTLESAPWASEQDLADFDVFLLSVIYLLSREPLPESILQQLR